jgi:hypothetical protein
MGVLDIVLATILFMIMVCVLAYVFYEWWCFAYCDACGARNRILVPQLVVSKKVVNVDKKRYKWDTINQTVQLMVAVYRHDYGCCEYCSAKQTVCVSRSYWPTYEPDGEPFPVKLCKHCKGAGTIYPKWICGGVDAQTCPLCEGRRWMKKVK